MEGKEGGRSGRRGGRGEEKKEEQEIKRGQDKRKETETCSKENLDFTFS